MLNEAYWKTLYTLFSNTMMSAAYRTKLNIILLLAYQDNRLFVHPILADS